MALFDAQSLAQKRSFVFLVGKGALICISPNLAFLCGCMKCRGHVTSGRQTTEKQIPQEQRTGKNKGPKKKK